MVTNETSQASSGRLSATGSSSEQTIRRSLTGEDRSPFARACAGGRPSWRRMCEWIWFATEGRIKHLAMMRRSRSSFRFAATSVLIMAFGLGLAQSSIRGWRWVTAVASLEPTGSTSPSGNGWVLAASMPRSAPAGHLPEMPAALWWNTTQAILMGLAGFLAGGFALALLLWLVRIGVTRAHLPRYRKEQRMSAALHYSTAWVVPLFAATLLWTSRVASWIGELEHWRWFPPRRGVELSSAVVGAFGLALWWFWLVKMGATAPARTRSRVLAFLALGAPLIAIAVGAGWWFGLDRLHVIVRDALQLSF